MDKNSNEMPNHDDQNDREMADLFERAAHKGPPADSAFLARLREESATAFQSVAEPASTPLEKTPQRKSQMMVYSIRILAVAAAVAVGAFFMPQGDPQGEGVGLSGVLNRVASARTLHMELNSNGNSATVWVRQPGQMRLNLSDGTYKITQGSRQWHIDEKANRAVSRPSSYFDREGEFDLLQLLQVPDLQGFDQALKKATRQKTERDGKKIDLYTALIEDEKQQEAVRIECVVDSRTGTIRTLRSFEIHGERIKPIAEVKFLSVDKAVDEELFVLGKNLTEGVRIGKIADMQGLVSVKPVMHRRFTPVTGPVILQPNDYLRTDVRGANAVVVHLVAGAVVTLGPGTLLELPTPKSLKLASGEVKIVASKKHPVELVGPNKKQIQVSGTAHYRVDRQTNDLVLVKKPPLWLARFEGTTAHDSIGSLVANVDGRNVPLTVGYHKVTVDVRDQIARTVIEESFVNRTDGRLEGVFYFPLPQDASISGFGMWIGNELVEADVVEKQRAREIYETILRERRDPGLLEWSGGNIFKARIFPIEAHSEKRIKLTYTQVLPLKNGRYRYSYALKSEMLKLHPLRELAIDLRLSSTMPLGEVTCPTHLARIESTAHSAHVEFTAQEYSPDRDFEVVIDTDDQQQDVVVIPHRRGEDGYFMMQLTPPNSGGRWQRESLPDGEPMELLILADTSGSMDAEARKTQAKLIASLFNSLTPEDRVNLATCDVDCNWVFDESLSATEKNTTQIREHLARRISLGWTDLDRAFESAAARCGPNTQLVYVGDGVVNTSDADPVAMANRLKRLFKGKQSTLHAVSVSSSFESIVLNAIAAQGGGSVRQVSGERTPAKVAAELLAEITQPAIRDLSVSFRGLQTARVYPGKLPNLAFGKQQIILGRYLPEGSDQHGEVVVTGVLSGKPVKFSTKVLLADAEQGNSFIPRLWARMHLDALLEQGASQRIKDEIIALSEEYHIITPYTSLLVLESDADRERFKVRRRFQMRDGQRFFAQGRDQANFELMQKQMRLAGNWRVGLRRQVLRELLGLGRNPNIFAQETPFFSLVGWDGRDAGSRGSLDSSVVTYSSRSGQENNFLGDFDFRSSGELGRYRGQPNYERSWGDGQRSAEEDLFAFDPQGEKVSSDGELMFSKPLELELDEVMEMPAATMPGEERSWQSYSPSDLASLRKKEVSLNRLEDQMGGGMGGGGLGRRLRPGFQRTGLGIAHGFFAGDVLQSNQSVYSTNWLTYPFLAIGSPPQLPQPAKQRWPVEARRLSESLLRSEPLASLTGGLQVKQTSESFDPHWDRLTGKGESLTLVSPKAWLSRSGGGQLAKTINWCDGQHRAALSVDLGLGRIRKSTATDLKYPPLSLTGFELRSLEYSYSTHQVEIKPQEDERTLMVLSYPANPASEVHILIDTQRHVVLQIEYRQDGKVTRTTRFDKFVEVAGAWFATRVESLNADGQRTSSTQVKFTELDAAKFTARMKKELASRDRVQLLREPLPAVAEAKQAVADGKDDFEDRMTLAIHFALIQNWERVKEQLEAATKLASDKPGMRWVRYALMKQSRQREQLRKAIMLEAAAAAKASERTYYLATYLVGQASGVFSAGEMLELLDALRAVYEKQPKYLLAMKSWQQQRLSYLDSTGQSDVALRLRRELAESYPHDYSLQQQYANGLSGVGDFAGAYAWLERTIVPERRWRDYEEDSLRGTYTNLLQNEGRFDDMVEYLAAWVAKEPTSENPYRQYLSACVKADQEEEANALIAQWLDVQIDDDSTVLEPSKVQRLSAAIYQAIGQGYNLHTNRMEERWLKPLAKLVDQLATHKTLAHLADRVMNQGQFRQKDECRRLRKQMADRLTNQIETLPVKRVAVLVGWIWPNDPAVEVRQWRTIAQGLESRWEKEKDANLKNQLAAPLVRILSGKLPVEEYLTFLRRQVAQGPEQYRASYVNQLFSAILAQPWTAKLEDEAFALLSRLSDAEQPSQRLKTEVAALHRLTDRMLQARYAALMAQVEHQEELTRTEQREKRRENLLAARQGFAARLQKEMKGANDDLRAWLGVERLYLMVLLKQDLDGVTQECWEVLGPAPRKPVPLAKADGQNKSQDTTEIMLAEMLRERHLAILLNLAARRDADKKLAVRLLDYFDQGIKIAGDEKTSPARWQMMKYRLLIALDRPKELEASLRKWIEPADANNYWRRALAYLMAEQGRIKEAIALLQKVEKADELSPADYRALAGWYMVDDQRDQHERALIRVFKMSEDWKLSNWLSRQLQPWQRSDTEMPSEMNPDVFRVFAALFEKSNSPQSYLSQLREFYRATRDFRLLASLADGVVGHTTGRVYPMLNSTGSVLSEVRDEATADSLVEQIEKVRPRAKSIVDQRALDLLEMMVERRSSELLNQPGPHVDRALAAMQRAFRRQWSKGEPRLMADLLASLGKITQQSLAKEQIHQLTQLHRREKNGSIDRLHIAYALARTRWTYGQRDQAVDLLEAALAEHEAANDGVLPQYANQIISALVSYYESLGRYALGEEYLLARRKHPVNAQQKFWFTQRLMQLYNSALGNEGAVSLGSGEDLFRSVILLIDKELDTNNQSHRYSMVSQLCNIYRTAKNRKIEGVVASLRKFAFERLPKVLGQQTNNYQSIVNNVAHTLHDVAGPRAGLELLIASIENEPRWFRLNNQDGWNQHGYQLARWRNEVGEKLGDLEPRLLAIVLEELRQDLSSQRSRSRNLYQQNHSYFWKEKAADFAKVAEEVYAKRKKSGSTVKYIAEYLYWGLGRHERAIEILLVAHRQKLLDEGGQSKLVDFLHRRNRHRESIPILLPLVRQRPDNLQYRVLLMNAYYHVDRTKELLALLKATDEYFHEGSRWQENVIAKLARSCLENGLFEQSTAYYEEVISLHQRTQPGRGIGNGTLSRYYEQLSRAYFGLKKTPEAVDAACGAIVSWGPRHDRRADALSTLTRVLQGDMNLSQYVAQLDKEAEKTGMHNPIVRKALGTVYFNRQQYSRAAAQLKLAIELQPNDTETHQKLVECYDRLEDRDAAIAQLLESIRLSRRSLGLYKDLAQRYDALEQTKLAERARTSIVEALPNESEGHAMLAEVRQQQSRWNDAIAHWQQVAKIRALEPTGLLKLAEAQIHQKQWAAAAETCRTLRSRPWPSRFGNINSKISQLESRIDSGRKARN